MYYWALDMRGRKGGGGTDLAVVKGAFDGNVVHVCIGDGGHLSLLDGRDATLGVEYEDGDVLLIP